MNDVKQVTVRVFGRDFTGPAGTTDATRRAEKYGREVIARNDPLYGDGFYVFLIDPSGTCLPIILHRVEVKR